jgi:hypothetical protein
LDARRAVADNIRMNAVRIHRKVDSETLHLPEIRSMIGKQVEIIVMEEPAAPKTGDLSLLESIAGKDLIDPDALKQLRDASMI